MHILRNKYKSSGPQNFFFVKHKGKIPKVMQKKLLNQCISPLELFKKDGYKMFIKISSKVKTRLENVL